MKLTTIFSIAVLIAFFSGCADLNKDPTGVQNNKCRACHVFPPQGKVHAIHVDSMHYSCDYCHPGVLDSTQTVPAGHSEQPLTIKIAPSLDSAGVSSYNPVTKTCSAIYCHGYSPINGNPGTINDTGKKTGCTFCHGVPPVDTMHFAHVKTMKYKCGMCHIGATDSLLSAAAKLLHVNGVADISIDSTFDSAHVAVYNPSTKTCNAVYCHGYRGTTGGNPGTVSIFARDTGSNECTFCHGAPPVDSMHSAHVKTSKYSCGLCHQGATDTSLTIAARAKHVNRVADVKIDSSFDPAGGSSYNNATRTCNAVYCHGYGVVTGNTGTVAVTAKKTNCSFCHAVPPADSMHTAHIKTAKYTCSRCHQGATDTSLSAAAKVKHVNRTIDVKIDSLFDPSGTSTYNSTSKTCSAVYCHGYGVVSGNPGTVAVTAKKTNCSFCHAVPPVDSMHTAHVKTAKYPCAYCHQGATDTSLSTAAQAKHVNHLIDVKIDSTLNITGSPTYNSTSKTCNAVYCHGFGVVTGNTGTVAVSAQKTNCGFCHATPPTDSMHSAHVKKSKYSCGLCHAGATDTLLTAAAQTKHINRVVDVKIDSSFDSAGVSSYIPAKKTCNAVYCHGGYIKNNPGIVKLTDTSTGCGFCHSYSRLALPTHHTVYAPTAANPNPCNPCHVGYDTLGRVANPVLHINGKIDINLPSCTNVLCHVTYVPWVRKP